MTLSRPNSEKATLLTEVKQMLWYWRRIRKGLAMCLLCVGIFLSVFALYHIPAAAVLYPGILCTAVLLALGAVDAVREKRKLKNLSALKSLPEDLPDRLEAYDGDIDSIVLDPESIGGTLTIFGVIFALLLLRSLIQVRIANPLELLRSENVGEKPIKVKFLPGIAGAILLAAAYCIAIMTAGTFEAATWFFAAVIMVIAGTYLVMISGSVASCGLLKKWKNFYYKKQNFISVSSMAYRMKRNGAGLASICILATMVLVMISSTGSLYIGAEDALMTRYPYDISFGIALQSPEQAEDDCMDRLLGGFQAVYEENEITPNNEIYYFYASAAVHMTDENAGIGYTSTMALSQMYNLMFVREEDYNRVFGTDLCLQYGQAMIGTHNCTYGSDHISIENTELEIVGELPTELIAADMTASVYPTITLVVPELPNLDSLAVYFYYCADYDLSEEKITEAFSALQNNLPEKLKTEDGTFICAGECRANARQSFYSLFGGLFFIGVILSLIFAAAAALIIYYKQISEGYEDRHRFAIMQHVGMTREDIKKSIRSQELICRGWFLPPNTYDCGSFVVNGTAVVGKE